MRWNGATGRLKHLLSRAGKERAIVFIEEGVGIGAKHSSVSIQAVDNITLITPYVNDELCLDTRVSEILEGIINKFDSPIFWYYSPMAMVYSEHWKRTLTVYDCMEEVLTLKGADQRLLYYDLRLLEQSDIVFTNSSDLFQTKRHLHHSMHLIPDFRRTKKSVNDQAELSEDLRWNRIWTKMKGLVGAALDKKRVRSLVMNH